MKEIKTFEELFDIQADMYHSACSLDLMFVRYGFRIIDGYVLLIGADCKECLDLFYLSFENYDKWTHGEKAYFKDHYVED